MIAGMLRNVTQKLGLCMFMCAMVKSRYIGDGHPINRNPDNLYINPYYWVDDHPLLYQINGSLDPSTCGCFLFPPFSEVPWCYEESKMGGAFYIRGVRIQRGNPGNTNMKQQLTLDL